MQRLYFNFETGDVRLVPDASCPPMESETSFPNALVPDDVTMEMVSFKFTNGRIEPDILFPKIPITTPAGPSGSTAIETTTPTP